MQNLIATSTRKKGYAGAGQTYFFLSLIDLKIPLFTLLFSATAALAAV